MGSTTLAPGETTTLNVYTSMGRGMGGMHLFEITVNSSDPAPENDKVQVRVDFLE